MEKENEKLRKEIKILEQQIELIKELGSLRNDAQRLCEMYGSPVAYRQIQPVIYMPQYIYVPRYAPFPAFMGNGVYAI